MAEDVRLIDAQVVAGLGLCDLVQSRSWSGVSDETMTMVPSWLSQRVGVEWKLTPQEGCLLGLGDMDKALIEWTGICQVGL